MNAVQIATAVLTVVNFILIVRALIDHYKTRKLLENAMSHTAEEEKLLSAAGAEILAMLSAGVVARVELPPTQAVELIGVLQLALRHPALETGSGEYGGQIRETVVEFIGCLTVQVAPDPTSATARMIQRGFEGQ
jgi:hypothetical protein